MDDALDENGFEITSEITSELDFERIPRMPKVVKYDFGREVIFSPDIAYLV